MSNVASSSSMLSTSHVSFWDTLLFGTEWQFTKRTNWLKPLLHVCMPVIANMSPYHQQLFDSRINISRRSSSHKHATCLVRLPAVCWSSTGFVTPLGHRWRCCCRFTEGAKCWFRSSRNFPFPACVTHLFSRCSALPADSNDSWSYWTFGLRIMMMSVRLQPRIWAGAASWRIT